MNIKHNGSSDDNISISEQSISDYNTTTDELDDILLQNNKLFEEKTVQKQKRSFDVETLLAPETKKLRNCETEQSAIKASVLENTTITSSSSVSSSTVSSPSSSSPRAAIIDNSNKPEANINQSLLKARSFYQNYILSNNNPLFLYQLSTTMASNEKPKRFDESCAANKDFKNKRKEERQNYDNKKNSCKSLSEQKRLQSSNNDVEKWNETFSKIMARSYKNHNVSSSTSNSKTIKSSREEK